MCRLCEQYGDAKYGDGIWYLNPENYARNMYKLRKPGEAPKGADTGIETGTEAEIKFMFSEIVDAMEKGPEEYERVVRETDEWFQKQGLDGQVVPLKDAEKVVDFCSPITLMGCICRRQWRAIDERNELEYSCFGTGVGTLKWERWPERYKGGVKFVNSEEAKERLREFDRLGFVHGVMLFGHPFIGGLCQCDYPDCVQIRPAVDFGIVLLKSHYVSVVDYEICNGCRICAQRCKFGALKFEHTSQKPYIDPFKCYGCGLCETGCPRKAISLVERKSLPAVAEVWH